IKMLVMTSDDCLLGGSNAEITPLRPGRYNYTLNASFFSDKRYSGVELINLYVFPPSQVLKTNGVKINSTTAVFIVSSRLTDLIYYVEYGVNCSEDSDCMPSENCIGGDCIDFQCPECSYYNGSDCVVYDCCSDMDCRIGVSCVNHTCIKLPCLCGELVGDECFRYECCSQEDCSNGSACIGNRCIKNECNTSNQCPSGKICHGMACTDLICAGNEYAQDHSCMKLRCDLFQRATNHSCNYDFTLLMFVFLALVAFIVFSIFAMSRIRARSRRRL
ncbi:MAG: hypothetical protein KKD39_00200, partial [Candidatus Altiarchaeota archaeon]|nr:hypothetical protein [Candidatus Altiarchaeota archaeon]